MTDDKRDALLRRGAEEYAALIALVAQVRRDGRIDEEFSGTSRDRRVRDVLSHLLAWHLLMEGWYEDGMLDGTPAIPTDGYTWQELDALNAHLREKWQHIDIEEIERRLQASHLGLQRLVATHSEAELFTADVYAWTQGSELGEFCLECGGNHYLWARGAITEGLGLA